MKDTRAKVAIFAGATLASGWVGVGLNRVLGETDSMNSPGTLLWIITPSATSLALTVTDPELRTAMRRSWSPGRIRTYLPAVLLFPAAAGATVLTGRALGWIDLSGLQVKELASTMGRETPGAVVKNVAEEAAWRGWLTPRLEELGLPDPAVWLLSGLVWSLWHLPYYLFFLDRETVRQFWDVPRAVFASAATVTMIAWSIPYTELRRLDGSLWPSVVMHATEDVTQIPLATGGHAIIRRGREWLISPTVGLVSNALIAGAGLAIRALRKRTREA